MIDYREALDELAAALREDGLDVRVDRDAEELHVGPARRGPSARPAVVRLGHDDLERYLRDLQGDDPRPGIGLGLLATSLIESMTAVNDGESNLATEVRLRRDSSGHLGLIETRSEPGAPTPLPDDGPYGWVAERPADV